MKMQTTKLKKYAQYARRSMIEQVTVNLKLVRANDSAARRENPEAVKKLEEEIKATDQDQVIEKVAYTWFNRFCALRFMDVNRYTRIRVVSPTKGQVQPEILAEAKMGHIDEEVVNDKIRQQIFKLLDGETPSRDPQGEAYRLLVVGACNQWHRTMPFLFERIDDYTELLMPDDLLSGNSILAYTREAMTPDVCEDVEVIGWLYQFYISEKKDEVFDGLKNNKKITPENIPAATQLFTPHWIVRYLVENSLGRLWMLNHPNSKLTEQMDYYIKPEQPETDILGISKPEEIKICDPACGSGHMLTYAFDLLHAIYEEEGYEPAEIPEKILTHNLYGIEIDERAGELAAFALTMKARAKHKRFFRRQLQPNICVLVNIQFDEDELNNYIDFIGHDLFTAPLQTTLRQFEEADNFGSLIRPEITDVTEIVRTLEAKDVSGQLFLSDTHKKVLHALQQADYLSPKYHVVIANPPYMGSKGMNESLKNFAMQEYAEGKLDLFAMFMLRALSMVVRNGYSSMINMQSWMFLGSYENLRDLLLTRAEIQTMAHLGERAFDSIGGAVVSTTAFVLKKSASLGSIGIFIRLVNGENEKEKSELLRSAASDLNHKMRFTINSDTFERIPGMPIAYWASEALANTFENSSLLIELARPCQGMATTNNGKFVRDWHEVNIEKIGLSSSSENDAFESSKKWFPYNKGGEGRRWYGNADDIVNFENKGKTICDYIDNTPGVKVKSNGRVINRERFFLESISWSKISSGRIALRNYPQGFIFDVAGCSIFSDHSSLMNYLGFMNSAVCFRILECMSPTLNFEVGQINNLPIRALTTDKLQRSITVSEELISISQSDWDAYETSWDFTSLPLLNPDYRPPILKTSYQKLRAHWLEMTLEMQLLEEENNRIFIDAYLLQDELKPEVPLKEITLTCNPHFRYGGDKSEEELEALLLADTMREFISYAVGCMFGRYALDKSGLVLANQGETFEDYLKQIPDPSFTADDDNVIPMLDGDWFTDDITERFLKFLRITFGEEHYKDNLKFIETALGKNDKPKSIRDYFLKDFYNDHVKRYKKRPIYWLFSSPKGSFNALIYMHRYRQDTVSVVLNDYLREFRTKLTSRKHHLEAVSISASASQREKTQALKEIDKLNKMIGEMEDYEREVLYPLATEQIDIDLDDGVKVNYARFGTALKKIAGLN